MKGKCNGMVGRKAPHLQDALEGPGLSLEMEQQMPRWSPCMISSSSSSTVPEAPCSVSSTSTLRIAERDMFSLREASCRNSSHVPGTCSRQPSRSGQQASFDLAWKTSAK